MTKNAFIKFTNAVNTVLKEGKIPTSAKIRFVESLARRVKEAADVPDSWKSALDPKIPKSWTAVRSLKDNPNHTEEDILKAVKTNSSALRYANKQTPKIIKAAIDAAPESLRYVKNPTPDIIKYAIDKDPDNITGSIPKEYLTFDLALYAAKKAADPAYSISRIADHDIAVRVADKLGIDHDEIWPDPDWDQDEDSVI